MFDAILPPLSPWSGASRRFLAPQSDPLATPAELSRFETTPRYGETIAWMHSLASTTKQIELVTIGRSHERRDLWMAVASATGARTPEELRANGRPTVLAQACIHPGEADGKDAGMMMLRDLTAGRVQSPLLDRVNLLFVPILNPDGHERVSRFHRINQRGPRESGWRTNARHLNVNRDYMKLESAEARAMVGTLNRWRPDLYLDFHVTDGADYQYDLMLDWVGPFGYSPEIAAWLSDVYAPLVHERLIADGHCPGPITAAELDPKEQSPRLQKWLPLARFSQNYGDARHLPTVLVECHSLKARERRVLAAYVLLAASLSATASHAGTLRAAASASASRRRRSLPTAWMPDPDGWRRTSFMGIDFTVERSPLIGAPVERYHGQPITMEVHENTTFCPASAIDRPVAYWVPAAWSDIGEKLRLHGIAFDEIEEPRTQHVEMYRLTDYRFDAVPTEGRVRASAATATESRAQTYAAGSLRVPTDQPLGDLAALLLEPSSPDSLFAWGYFAELWPAPEMLPPYVMEPTAAAMLQQNVAIAQQFESAGDAGPVDVLDWFYRRSPYFKDDTAMYPIGRETAPLLPHARGES